MESSLLTHNYLIQKKDIVYQFGWAEVASWRVDEGKCWHLTAGSLAKPVKLTFFTKHVSIDCFALPMCTSDMVDVLFHIAGSY